MLVKGATDCPAPLDASLWADTMVTSASHNCNSTSFEREHVRITQNCKCKFRSTLLVLFGIPTRIHDAATKWWKQANSTRYTIMNLNILCNQCHRPSTGGLQSNTDMHTGSIKPWPTLWLALLTHCYQGAPYGAYVDLHQHWFRQVYFQGPLLLTWFNFNPRMDK